LLVTEEGKVVASRTHRMNDRLPWRIFGLIYAHPHPKSPDTTIIKNKAGLGLPTELTGEPVAEYLIDAPEQEKRLRTLKKVCRACHSRDLVEGHFASFFHTIEETNQKTLTATRIIMKAWNNGAAKGPAQHDSVFNESIEKKWVKQWLFYANSTRFASAMMGADYGVFAGGRWFMSQNTQEMADWLENELKQNKGKKK
ncbi:MAG: hydroxylamine oxidase, partial [bacterium]